MGKNYKLQIVTLFGLFLKQLKKNGTVDTNLNDLIVHISRPTTHEVVQLQTVVLFVGYLFSCWHSYCNNTTCKSRVISFKPIPKEGITVQ